MNGFITYAPDNVADYDIGTNATYQCNHGYIIVGVMTRECVQVSVDIAAFNGVVPVCQRKNCSAFIFAYTKVPLIVYRPTYFDHSPSVKD